MDLANVHIQKFNTIKEKTPEYTYIDYLKDYKKQQDENAIYEYIEIKECFIPIRKGLEQVKRNGFEYSYRNKFSAFGYQYMVQVYLIDDFNKWKNFISLGDFKILSDYNRKNFNVLKYLYIKDEVQEPLYSIFIGQSLIVLDNTNQEEVDFIINYCHKTLKTSSFKIG